MSFTNQMLGALGTATGALATGKYIQNQNKELAAKNAEDQQIVDTTKTAIKNDTIEAAAAISAHERKFKDMLEERGWDDLTKIKDEDIDELSKEVDSFRSGKLRNDRIGRIRDAGALYENYHDKKIDRIYKTGDQLNKAYESFRELNQRIAASRQLKFNLESAQARLQARGVK